MNINRRTFFRTTSFAGIGSFFPWKNAHTGSDDVGQTLEHRKIWINILQKISEPVLNNLSNNTLHVNMPVEALNPNAKKENKGAYLEAFGRLFAGIAPWFNSIPVDSFEKRLQKTYKNLLIESIGNAVAPGSPDYLIYTERNQTVVDAAFFAYALLRSKESIWDTLDSKVKRNVIEALKSTRIITPAINNKLLFSAIIEVFFMEVGEDYDQMRIEFAVLKTLEWYVGDGLYGDGPMFHWDYYNGYVIQPMLLDIIKKLKQRDLQYGDKYDEILIRAQRYAVIQERLISPEATFPAIGRSIPYRFGAFQLLAQIALMKALPIELSPAQVRCALTAVMWKMIGAPNTFDKEGWLKIGFYGHQPAIAENYINTGSLYLCSTALLPLGLSPGDEFWENMDQDWTSRKIWNGESVHKDQYLKEIN